MKLYLGLTVAVGCATIFPGAAADNFAVTEATEGRETMVAATLYHTAV